MTLLQGATVYMDTNALIYLTEGSSKFRTSLEGILQATLEAKARLVTSELAITEVLVAPLRDKNVSLVSAYNELFDSFVQALPIERAMLIRAAQLRARTLRLRTPDAIHLATAEHVGAHVFVTGDAGIAVNPPMVRYLLVDG